MNKKLIEVIKNLVNINSHTHNTAGVNKVQDYIEALIVDRVGDKVGSELYSKCDLGNLHIYEVVKNQDWPTLLLSGHIDTIHKPEGAVGFSKKGDRLYGDGIEDMKAGIAIMIESFIQSIDLPLNLIMVVNTDEEVGSKGYFDELSKYYKRADIVLVYESGNSKDGLETFDSNKLIVTRRKGAATFKATASGEKGHSGTVTEYEKRANAIHDLIEKLVDISKLADYDKGTTFNVGTIEGGDAINIIADKATAEFEFRVKNQDEFQRVQIATRDILTAKYIPGVDLDYTQDYIFHPIDRYPGIDKLIPVLEKLAKQVGYESVEEEFRAGISDANRIQEANPECLVLDGFGPYGEGGHTKEEFIVESDIEKSLELSTAFIQHLAKNPELLND